MQAAIAASKGERIGPYRLLELIGEGGMGRVHRAEHLATGRFCALKTVKQMSPERSLALRMEIAALRAVDHAGVVRIEDEGIHNGLPWYAMELLRGQTLAAYHRDLGSAGPESSSGSSFSPTTDPISGVQPISRILSSTALAKKVADVPTLGLYRALCEPLAHIHGRGMVHRDLKPANVFVRHDGTPVLMDFGLIGYARGAVGREILDAGDRVLGSIHYIAPERIEGRLVDARADLYSLGCMLYEAVTGRPPFVGAPREVLAQHVAACPVPPSEFVSGLPPDVEDLILALLAKAPRARIGHASDVAERLGRALGHAEIARPSHAAPLYRPELSGREDILASLDDFVQQARGGRGAMILLGGESGIGKTFLCSEFAFRAGRNGFRVITGECIGLSAPIAGSRDVSSGPLHPLRRFLQAVADICHERGSDDRQRILGDAAAYLAPYEPCLSVFAEPTTEVRAASLPGPARSEVVLAVLTETLRQFAVDAPVLLILDDLQWSDDLTLQFLSGLDRTFFIGLPLVIVGTFRADEASPSLERLAKSEACASFSLRSLDESALAKMVGDMLAIDRPPEHLVRFLTRESRGNPFFTAEYLRYLAGAGHLLRARGQWEMKRDAKALAEGGETPLVRGSLAELVSRRLEALSHGAQGVMRAAAVLGRDFRLDVLAAMLDADEPTLLASLREAEERQVAESVDSGSFRFVHDKLREAAYAAMSAEEAKVMHGRAANALEARPLGDTGTSAADLARHFERGGNLVKALEYFERAGDESIAKSAEKEIAAFFREALQIAERVGGVAAERRARWERELGSALHDSGELVECRHHLERSLHLLGLPMPSPTKPARLGAALAMNFCQQTAHRLSNRWLHRDAEQSQTILDAVRALDRIQQACFYTGDALPMMYACLRMLNLAESARPSPELTIAYTNAHAVAGVLPSPRLAEIYRRRALENMALAPDAVAETYFLTLSGVYLTGLGSWDLALTTLSRGLELAERLDFARRIREIFGALGVVHFCRGDFAAARRQADAQQAVAVQKDPQAFCWALLSRAQVLLLEGRAEAGLGEVLGTTQFLARLGRPERIWADSVQAAAHVQLGELRLADEASRRALGEIEIAPTVSHYTIDAYRACAEVRVRLAHEPSTSSPEMLRLADKACRALAKLAGVFPIAAPRSLLVEGVRSFKMGRRKRALHSIEKSLAAAAGLGMRYDSARAHLALARILTPGEERALHERAADSLLRELGADPVSAAPL